MIKHANIIYMPTISALGGIETYVYELVKKYHNLDIAVVSRYCDEKQRERIEKYCKVYIYTNEDIDCKVAIINYDQSIIPHINKEAKIYQTIHADYTSDIYENKPKDNPRVTGFICITEYLQDKMSAYLPKEKLLYNFNPLTIEDNEKPIILVTASRLHKNKGVERMKKLILEMDKQNISYIWYIITNDIGVIQSPNVIIIKNRLDVSRFVNQATYVVLLSDSEACSYTLNEALYRNIPIITTPLPYLDEIGVRNNENAYIIDFNCENISDVVSKIKSVPKFNFKRIEDNYDKILSKTKSSYISDYDKLVYVRVREQINHYYDMKLNKEVYYKDGEYIVTKHRANQLIKAGVCEYIRDVEKNN